MGVNKIRADFHNILGDSAPSNSTVAKWTNEFKCVWESLKDDTHSGGPKYVTTQEIITKVYKMDSEESRLRVREVAEAVRIPSDWVGHILHFKWEIGYETIIC